ncbi:MAG: DNA topoisomerase (ATP-hydrolyzing) subunit B [Chloroflexi bacterium]|nr:DNA topoisomerase (ATP-hydrolyzing) subunit B [Chloroflexota bacterium]MDA1172950.1 DNA topoisomerase (ATP-hydrolyzing) subunit B [Chloroflexota bacterium]
MVDQKQSDYTASDIQVLEGLEAVRRRPGMYIGSTDQRGLHHLVYEIVDNGVDEAMAGYCDHVTITMFDDGSVGVSDNGRGIPVDLHATTGKSALETIMTTLHAGGKFGGGAYKVSGGLHGVGASVVNALSSEMRVDVARDGQHYHQEYARGIPTTEMIEDGPIADDDPHQQGTVVRFLADETTFGPINYDHDTLVQRFREMAYLNKGIWLTFRSEARPENDRTFYFEGGIASFVRQLNHNREALQDEPFYMEQQGEGTMVEVALQYNSGFYENTLAFANCINTVDGGSHVVGFRAGLTRAINSYAKKSKILRDDQANFSGEDVREGLTAIISVRLEEPQFEGQTKGKLGNAEVKTAVEQLLVQHLEFYLEEHPQEARRILEKCMTSQRARDAARKARDLVIRKNAMDGGSLPGKLADCSEKSPELSELFVVEGESAGGSAKMGRDRRTQAILPLRGKILNVEKARPDRMLAHEEIRALITAIGAGLGEDFNMPKLRYHKVIIMTDADVDGAHIRTLLLTFFFRNMRELIDAGHLYVAQPPLYRTSRGRSVEYKYAEADKDAWMSNQLYGRVSVSNDDASVTMTGPKLSTLLELIREFQGWVAPLSSLGLAPELAGALFQGSAQGKYRLAFEGSETLQAVADWFTEYGYECKPIEDLKEGRFLLEVPGHGTINVKAVLESVSSHRANEVFPRVAEWVAEHSFSITRRDNEVAAGLAWFDLVTALERHSDRSGVNLQRYKGLGEMNPDQLWETTMDPTKRTLLQINADQAAEADEVFTTLMGDLVQPRKEFIQAHARQVKNLDI